MIFFVSKIIARLWRVTITVRCVFFIWVIQRLYFSRINTKKSLLILPHCRRLRRQRRLKYLQNPSIIERAKLDKTIEWSERERNEMKTLRKLNEFAKFFFGSIFIFIRWSLCTYGRTSFRLLRIKFICIKLKWNPNLFKFYFQ